MEKDAPDTPPPPLDCADYYWAHPVAQQNGLATVSLAASASVTGSEGCVRGAQRVSTGKKRVGEGCPRQTR